MNFPMYATKATSPNRFTSTSASMLGAVALLASAMLTLTATPLPAQEASQEQTERGFKLMNEESLGGLNLEMSAKDITALLGKPEKMGKDIEWEALGEYVQQWSWPKSGLVAEMFRKRKAAANAC